VSATPRLDVTAAACLRAPESTTLARASRHDPLSSRALTMLAALETSRRSWNSTLAFAGLWLVPVLTAVGAPAGAEPALSDADMIFFESHIRPILVENCTECHGDQKQKGGLRLD
jgi:hypothetical protein